MSGTTHLDPRHLWLAGLGGLVLARRQSGKALHSARSQLSLRTAQARSLAIDTGLVARGLAMTLQEKLQDRLAA